MLNLRLNQIIYIYLFIYLGKGGRGCFFNKNKGTLNQINHHPPPKDIAYSKLESDEFNAIIIPNPTNITSNPATNPIPVLCDDNLVEISSCFPNKSSLDGFVFFSDNTSRCIREYTGMYAK